MILRVYIISLRVIMGEGTDCHTQCAHWVRNDREDGAVGSTMGILRHRGCLRMTGVFFGVR